LRGGTCPIAGDATVILCG